MRISLLPVTLFVDNPFAVLTTVVAPAVLTNACLVLCLGASNRIARVVDRSRVVADHLNALAANNPERRPWEQQLDGLRARADYLSWALRLLYAPLDAFAAAALVAVLGSVIAASDLPYAFRVAALLGLAVGTVGVGGLAAGCLLMVQEVRLALKQTADEAEAAMASRSGSSILAFGAIVQPLSETPGALPAEGGRTTAAMLASPFGQALKISEDGIIGFYENGRCVWEI